MFEITWFRDLLHYRYKKEDGEWKTGIYAPIGVVNPSASPATVTGYGDIPVSMPAALVIDTQRTFGLHDIEEILKGKDYKVIRVRIPLVRYLDLKIDDQELTDKKLELSGEARLGDSAITTERHPFWYPFDRYSFDFIYTSFYAARVTLNFRNIEDLELSSTKLKFTVKPNQKEVKNIPLFRKDKLGKHIWPIIALLITFIFQTIQIEARNRLFTWWFRLAIYFFSFLLILFTLPNPMNVPKVNILSLCTWILFVFLLIGGELYLNRKSIREGG